MRLNTIILFTFSLAIFMINSCSKDKVPSPPELSKWEKMVGHYKVYDTLGVLLYEMDIEHTRNEETNRDYLHFNSFDEEFELIAEQQMFEIESQPNLVRIGIHDTLFDNQGNRWKIFDGGSATNYSRFQNDTFYVLFDKTNINYYIQDLVPYSSCECEHIAVKQ